MKLRCIGTELYFILFYLTKTRKILYPGSLRFEKKKPHNHANKDITIVQCCINF